MAAVSRPSRRRLPGRGPHAGTPACRPAGRTGPSLGSAGPDRSSTPLATGPWVPAVFFSLTSDGHLKPGRPDLPRTVVPALRAELDRDTERCSRFQQCLCDYAACLEVSEQPGTA